MSAGTEAATAQAAKETAHVVNANVPEMHLFMTNFPFPGSRGHVA